MMSDKEHTEKYRDLYRRLGVDALKELIPVPLNRIATAYDEGDEYLNSIPLQVWDKAVLGEGHLDPPKCQTCKQVIKRTPDNPNLRDDWPYGVLRRTARNPNLPWKNVPHLSLAERVCVLKTLALDLAFNLE